LEASRVLSKKANKVLIKVNICGGVPDRKGTFTSTNVVDTLVDLVRGAGGVPTIADSDMIWTRSGQRPRILGGKSGLSVRM